MENNDSKDSFYRDELEDISAGDYSLEDPMTFWNAEKKTLFKKILGRSETPFILMGIVLVVLVIVLFAVFPRGGRTPSASADGALSERLAQMEARLGDMQGQIEQIAGMKQEIELLKNSAAGAPDASVTLQMERVTGELSSLKKEMTDIRKNLTGTAASQTPAAPPQTPVAAPKAENKSVGTQDVYHEVQKGDTLYSLGRRYGVSVEKIRERNGLSAQDPINIGQKLWIK